MSGHLTLISCGIGPESITQAHADAVKSANILSGGKRLISWFKEFDGDTIEIGSHASETVKELAELAKTRKVAVLASGDSLFFGIGRLFLKHLNSEQITILPNITAAQTAFARIHFPWEQAQFFSVHGRKSVLPWRAILKATCAVIYCDSKRSPAATASEILSRFPTSATRSVAIAANLGSEDTVWQGTLSDASKTTIKGMSILIIQSDKSTDCNNPALTLGLPDSEYEHERNLITHPEVRSIVLSKLRLQSGVLWDLGAGSGSVTIEAAGLCDGLDVYAVEMKEARVSQIRNNALQAGLNDYTVVEGDILKVINDLPKPQSVFIGGGGDSIAEIAEAAYSALSVGGQMVITAIKEETISAITSAMSEKACDVIEVAIRRQESLGGGTMMKPENPITIFTFKKDVV